METHNKTQLILRIMNVLFWIVFIGLCIQTGAITYSFLVSLFLNEEATKNLYLELNLSDVRALGLFHYISIGLPIVIIFFLKTYMAYLAVKISTKLKLAQPFNITISNLITQISHVTLLISFFQLSAKTYYNGLIKEGSNLTSLQNYIGNGGEFLFLAGIIFIIAQVFKRGLEIQSENELTI